MESGAAEPGPPAAAVRARPSRLAGAGAVVACIVAADQATKSYAVAHWETHPKSLIGSHVELVVTRNSGSAFSRFQGLTPLLALGAIVITVVLVRIARSTSDRVTFAALVVLLGGALGNLTDRLLRSPAFFRGYVVDFVKVGWWPVFNVADSCITVGAILLLWRAFAVPNDEACR